MTSPSDDLTHMIVSFTDFLVGYADEISDEDYDRLNRLRNELTKMLEEITVEIPSGACLCGSKDGFHSEECIEANA